MTQTLIEVNLSSPPDQHSTALHNRWHPEIPAVAEVRPGAVFHVECIDWAEGEIKDIDSAENVRVVDLTQVHYLSGPIAVKGAKPRDLLVVDILDFGCLPNAEWGFTEIFAKKMVAVFLRDPFPKAQKTIWNIVDIPNACCTLALPTQIFEFNIKPKQGGQTIFKR